MRSAARCRATIWPTWSKGGTTPVLPPAELAAIGYRLAAYPLTLMAAAMNAMKATLQAFQEGRAPEGLMDFAELRRVVGFDDYYAAEERYANPRE